MRSTILLSACLLLFLSGVSQGHDVITTRITWNREISRIFYDRCISCHRQGGMSFSMMTYAEARPWAVAINDEVLSRRMPPWGAVKGFGEFRNDQALTAEQLEMITSWVQGGVPEGEPGDVVPQPKISEFFSTDQRDHGVTISGDFKLGSPFVLDGLRPLRVPDNQSLQVTADLPDGSVQPLLWLYEYKKQYEHPFLLQAPLELPTGTTIRGVPPEATILLLPAPATVLGQSETK